MRDFPIALSIAGSDSGGGAGIQADLKTFQMRGVFGTCVIVALTAQNTKGVHKIEQVDTKMIKAQIDALADDFKIKAYKIGMLANKKCIKCVADALEKYDFGPLILDPVMVAKGAERLLDFDAIDTLKKMLLPKTFLLTPNLPEVKMLTNIEVKDDKSAKEAFLCLKNLGVKNVLIKGGHTQDFVGETSDDWLFTSENEMIKFHAKRFKTPHTHGTGCTLSSCICAEIAKGVSLKTAVKIAKDFITCAISNPLNIGNKYGPVNHWAYKDKL